MEEADEAEGEPERSTGLSLDEIRVPFCRDLASQTLKKLGIIGPPVPVEQLARRLGFVIETCRLPDGVDGRLRIIDGARIIELAAGQPLVRHRFSLAHELGHDRLGHYCYGTHDTPLAERQANIFAGALLVPATWVRQDITKYRTISAFMERYQVSREVMFISLQGARLLNRVRM
jgi:hypothetical protein